MISLERRLTNDENLKVALAVLQAEMATAAELQQADAWLVQRTPRIGKLALKLGKLTMTQIFEILRHQAVEGGLFGEIAESKGLLSRKDILELLELQTNLTPRLIDALVSLHILSMPQATMICQQASVSLPSKFSEQSLMETIAADSSLCLEGGPFAWI